MAQPDYVPITAADRVRPAERLPAPDPWFQARPAEVTSAPPSGRKFGVAGPDQGYGLKLARRFADRLELGEGETAANAIAGCLGVGLKRSTVFDRAPVVHDFEHAFTLFGFLGAAPAELVAFRTELFGGASHHYWEQRDIAGRVPESTLRLTPAAVRERLSDWRSLFETD